MTDLYFSGATSYPSYGKYSYDPKTGVGFSSPATGDEMAAAKPAVVVQQAAAPAPEKHSWVYRFLNTPVAPSPDYGCTDNKSTTPNPVDILKQDGGELPLQQPKSDGGVPGGKSQYTTDSGAVVTYTTPSGIDAQGGEANPPFIDPTDPGTTVKPPVTDSGVPIIPNDIFFQIPLTGLLYQETPGILLDSSTIPNEKCGTYLCGSGLQNLNLAIKLGLDSTQIQIPNTNPAQFLGCFDGLVRINQLSQDDIANSVPGCTLPGYESFKLCPGPNIDPVVYVAGYTLKGYKFQGGKDVPMEPITKTLTDPVALYQNPASGTLLGSLCSATPNPYIIDIPKELYSDGLLKMVLQFNLIAYFMNKDPQGIFLSGVKGSFIVNNNPNPTDGGAK